MLGTCSSISRPFRFDVHISPTRMTSCFNIGSQ